MCGVARESHANRCAVEKALVGKDELPKDNNGKDLHQSDLIGPDVDLGKDVHFDSSGFGLDSKCPFGAVDYSLGETSASINLSALCDSILGLRAFIMIMASVACWRIMRGENRAGGLI